MGWRQTNLTHKTRILILELTLKMRILKNVLKRKIATTDKRLDKIPFRQKL
jgi:hypothetical protein